MLFGSLFLNPSKKEASKGDVLSTIVAISPSPSTTSLQAEANDIFSFPPFPSPNPQAYTTSPLESFSPPSSLSTASSSSSTTSTPATSPSQSPSPTLRRGVPPGTRLRKPSINQDTVIFENSTPKITGNITPRSSSLSIATMEHPTKKERRGSKGTANEGAYEDAVRIAEGAWGEKSVRFDKEAPHIIPQ